MAEAGIIKPGDPEFSGWERKWAKPEYIPITKYLENMFVIDTGELWTNWPHLTRIFNDVFTPDENGVLPYNQLIMSVRKKCLLPSERVWLTDGRFVAAGALDQNSELWALDVSLNRYVPATATVSSNDLAECISITLQSGRTIQRTTNEPALTWDGWVPLGELEVGQQIAIPNEVPEPVTPLRVDRNILAFIAYMIGKGSCSSGNCRFSQNDGILADDFVRVCNELGLTVRKAKDKKCATYNVSNGGREILKRYGLYGTNSYTKRIPEEFFQVSNDDLAYFIGCLWGTDGHLCLCPNGNTGKIGIGYGSMSEGLIDDLAAILQRFGLYPKKSVAIVDGRHGVHNWRLLFSNQCEARSFIDTFNVIGKEENAQKIRTHLDSLTKVRYPRYSVYPDELWDKIFSLYEASGKTWPRDCSTSPKRTTWMLNRPFVEGIFAHFDEPPDERFKLPVLWDRITDIEFLGERETVCVEVPGYENYLTTTVTHNSLKSAVQSAIANWYMYGGLAELNDQLYFAAQSIDHAKSLAYDGLRTSIQLNPKLQAETPINDQKQIVTNRGVTVKPVAANYATIAGVNPSLVFFDEVWASEKDGSRHLFAELVPSPTRRNQMRIISSYAGFMNTSLLLYEMYKKVVRKENRIDDKYPIYVYDKTYAFWSEGDWPNEIYFPWHTKKWFDQKRQEPGVTLQDYKRIYTNEWVENQSGLEQEDWKRCVEMGESLGYLIPPAPNRSIQLGVGVDGAHKRDRAAIVSFFKKDGRIYLGPRQTFYPKPGNPVSFEHDIEAYIRWLADSFTVLAVYYDPTQMVRSAETLWKEGIPMIEYVQSIPNLITMTSNFIELMRYGQLVMYPDEELRMESAMVTIQEVQGKGQKMVKTSDTKKIDSIIAAAMGALATVKCVPDYGDLTGQFLPLQR